MVIDIIILSLILLFVLFGLIKGFTKSILSLFSWIVCLGLSVAFAKPFARILESWFGFGSFMGTKFVESAKCLPAIQGEMLGSDIISHITSTENSLIGSLFKKFINPTTFYTTETLTSTLSTNVGSLLLLLVSGIILFVVIKLLVLIIGKIIEKVTNKSKSLRSIDRILGGGLGFVKVSLIICVLLIICYVLGSIIPTEWLETSRVLNFYYKVSITLFDNTISKININSLIANII